MYRGVGAVRGERAEEANGKCLSCAGQRAQSLEQHDLGQVNYLCEKPMLYS